MTHNPNKPVAFLWVGLLLPGTALVLLATAGRGPARPARHGAGPSRPQSLVPGLPLFFEKTQAQAAAPASFLAHGGGFSMALCAQEVVLTLRSPTAVPPSARVAK